MAGLVALVAVVVVVAHGQADKQPPKSCTTPAFEVTSSDVAVGESFTATVTGPANGRYILALDATTIIGVAGREVASPATAVVLQRIVPLVGCRQTRTVALPASVRAGAHILGLFRVGTGGRVTALQTMTLDVS